MPIVTEDSAALQFGKEYAERLRYCRDTGAWFEWNGNVWRRNSTGIAFQWARELTRALVKEQPDRLRYVSSKTAFASGVEKLCKSDPVFAVTIDNWDNDPWLLGTPDGTVDLRTGELRPANQDHFITKATAVAPATTAECPMWLRFLREATNGDAELVSFLEQWAGYSLTGVTREHALVFVFGCGPVAGIVLAAIAALAAYGRQLGPGTERRGHGYPACSEPAAELADAEALLSCACIRFVPGFLRSCGGAVRRVRFLVSGDDDDDRTGPPATTRL